MTGHMMRMSRVHRVISREEACRTVSIQQNEEQLAALKIQYQKHWIVSLTGIQCIMDGLMGGCLDG